MATRSGNARGFLTVLLGAVVLGALAYLAWSRSQGRTPTTNVPRFVLLLSIDTLRADRVGPQGDGSSATPQLDKLATVSR